MFDLFIKTAKKLRKENEVEDGKKLDFWNEKARINCLTRQVEQLEKSIENLEEGSKALLKIIEFKNVSDLSIYQDFKYKKWSELHELVRYYFKDRFCLNVIKYGGVGIPVGRYAHINEHIGETIDRYYVFNEDGKSVNKYEEK